MDIIAVGVAALSAGLIAGLAFGRWAADSGWVISACEGHPSRRIAHHCRGNYYAVIPWDEFARNWQLRPVERPLMPPRPVGPGDRNLIAIRPRTATGDLSPTRPPGVGSGK